MTLRSLAPIALGLFTVVAPLGAQSPEKRLVGYFTSWSVYVRNYHVPDIPATKITHINYAFANVQNGRIALGDPYADIDKWYPGDCWNPGCLRGSFHRLQILKQNNPHVKTLISVGGWTWSGRFSDAVLTPQSRATFAQSIVDFVVQYDFDGADIDWEYPVSGGLASNTTRPQDKQNYTLFLQELRSRLDARGLQNGRSYLLTIAAPANPAIIANLEVTRIHPLLDWINIMTYDLHGPWGDPFTGFNAPLYSDPLDPTPEPMRSSFNVAAAVDNYLQLGVPREKLQTGVPFYGRGFGNVTGGTHGTYGTYSGPAPFGTWENGVFDYSDLHQNYINRNGYTARWNDTTRVPWVWNPQARVFISYDDPRSMLEKAWFVKAAGLGGAMFWEFSGDRSSHLLDRLSDELLARPALRATVREVSVGTPGLVDLHVEGGAGRAGSIYLVLLGISGTWPGLPFAGEMLPVNYDWLTGASAQLGNGPILPRTLGILDGLGGARAGVDFRAAPTLPPQLVGMRMSAAAWVFAAPGAVVGVPTNAVDVVIRP